MFERTSLFLFVYYLCGYSAQMVKVYRDNHNPVMFIWRNSCVQVVPVKFPWRNSSNDFRKKINYFFPMCCELIKMYYLCTSNKSNNLNF